MSEMPAVVRTGAALGAAMLAATAAAALSVRTAMLATDGVPAMQAGVPIAGAAVVVLCVLALRRFAWFVLVLIGARASLDALKGAGVGPLEPTAALGAAFCLAAVLWLAARRGARDRGPTNTMTVAWVLMLLAATASLVGADRPLVGALELARFVAIVVMFAVLGDLLTDATRRRQVITAVYASALIPLVVGLWQLGSGQGAVLIGGFSRVRGTFLHSNPFAIYLAFLIVAGVAVLPHLRRSSQVLLTGLLIVSGVCLLATYTRGAWMAAVAGLFVVAWIQARRFLPIAVVGLAVFVLAVPGVSERFSDLDTTEGLSGAPANSLSWRMEHWQDAIALARRNPVTGAGLRAVVVESSSEQPAHSDVVRAYAEMGLLGLAAYAWLILQFAVTARRSLRAPAVGLDRGIAVAFTGCAVTFVVASLSANVLTQVAVLWYFVPFCAGASIVARNHAVPAEEVTS